MALQLEWESEQGFTCSNAYAVVSKAILRREIERQPVPIIAEDGSHTPSDEVNIIKSHNIDFKVDIYANQAAADDAKNPIDGFSLRIPLNSNQGKTQYNIVKQCYLYLKEQEGWTGAVDC
tara:strand:+ start:1266 stop:1625 length:360 start_codon:yes stop_codon:yes gene_type:complete